jgi:plastocyanin/LysM repeat protein
MGRRIQLAIVAVGVIAAAAWVSRGAQAGPLAQPVPEVVVMIEDNVFRPRMTTVEAGSTVVWVNEGANDHTTTSDSDVWDSETLKPGDDFSFEFAEPGIYTYYCAFHRARGMVGTVVVLDSDGAAGGDDGDGAGDSGDAGDDGDEGADSDDGAVEPADDTADQGDQAADEPMDDTDGDDADGTDGPGSKGAMGYPPPADMSGEGEPDADMERAGEGAMEGRPGYAEGDSPDTDADADDARNMDDLQGQYGSGDARDDENGRNGRGDGNGRDDDYAEGRPGDYADEHGYAAGDGYYVVRPGDTLSGIAMRLGVPIMSLAYANGIYNLDHIRFGEVLAIPGHDGYAGDGGYPDGYAHSYDSYGGSGYGYGYGQGYDSTPYSYAPAYGYYPYAYGMNYGYTKPTYGSGYTKPNYGYGYTTPNYGYAKPTYTKPTYGYGYAKPTYGFGWAKKAYGHVYGWP